MFDNYYVVSRETVTMTYVPVPNFTELPPSVLSLDLKKLNVSLLWLIATVSRETFSRMIIQNKRKPENCLFHVEHEFDGAIMAS